MIELRTLGATELASSESGHALAPAAQPKRLALLAYLAVAEGSAFRRRDIVVAQLWPELDTQRARAALRQALHALRRALGEESIITRGEEEIGVNPAVVSCDAVAFRQRCDAGQFAAALELYRGEFLHGFFASDVAPEFEQWIEETRMDLRRRAAAAAWTLSDEARESGDVGNAVTLARRATTLLPDDERAIARLIALLDAAGDRVGALESYDALARYLATEYGAEPSPETQALIARVRTRTHATPAAVPEHPSEPPIIAPSASSETTPVAAHHQLRRRLPYVGIADLILIASAAAFAVFQAGRLSDIPVPIAVMPFVNADGDTSRAYVADGVTDELITDLSQVSTLRVINRKTMMAYHGSRKSAADVAKELGAEAIVYGTLQDAGDTIRITVRLVRPQADSAPWSRTFDGMRGDLLRIEREAARALAERLRGTLTATQQTRLGHATPRDPAALDAYIRGRYYWNERRGPSLLRAIGLFEDALHVDPTFALAYSGMADAFVQLGYTNVLTPADAFPKARSAALRALSLDSSLAEPHAALGFVNLYYDWNWPAAEHEFQRAIAMNPSYATAHEWYGLYLAAMGRFGEARAQESRAQELDPLSVAIAGTAGWVLYYAGELEPAKRELAIALRTDSIFPLGHLYMARVHQALGNADSAFAHMRATGPLRTWPPTIIGEGHLFATLGRTSDAIATLARLDSMSKTQYVTAYGRALVHAAMNNRDSAFAWLDTAYTERTNWMVWLNRDPRWSSIRNDPRFAKLTARMKLPE